MLQGLRTVIYGVSDIEKGKKWYTEALGFEPYFDEPFYVGFNVEGYELGLDPNAKPVTKASAGVVAYWGVDDITSEVKRLLSIGAKANTDIQEVGGVIYVATVLDLIHNPHFKLPG